MEHVTYRVPKSSAGLVEKLFAAYQVPHEELGNAIWSSNPLVDAAGAASCGAGRRQSFASSSLDEASGANKTFADREQGETMHEHPTPPDHPQPPKGPPLRVPLPDESSTTAPPLPPGPPEK